MNTNTQNLLINIPFDYNKLNLCSTIYDVKIEDKLAPIMSRAIKRILHCRNEDEKTVVCLELASECFKTYRWRFEQVQKVKFAVYQKNKLCIGSITKTLLRMKELWSRSLQLAQVSAEISETLKQKFGEILKVGRKQCLWEACLVEMGTLNKSRHELLDFVAHNFKIVDLDEPIYTWQKNMSPNASIGTTVSHWRSLKENFSTQSINGVSCEAETKQCFSDIIYPWFVNEERLRFSSSVPSLTEKVKVVASLIRKATFIWEMCFEKLCQDGRYSHALYLIRELDPRGSKQNAYDYSQIFLKTVTGFFDKTKAKLSDVEYQAAQSIKTEYESYTKISKDIHELRLVLDKLSATPLAETDLVDKYDALSFLHTKVEFAEYFHDEFIKWLFDAGNKSDLIKKIELILKFFNHSNPEKSK